MNLIDRDEVLKILRRKCSEGFRDIDGDWVEGSINKSAINEVKNLTVHNNSGLKGHWIICSDGYYPYCSECREEPKGGNMTDFCPNCGADMRDKT